MNANSTALAANLESVAMAIYRAGGDHDDVREAHGRIKAMHAKKGLEASAKLCQKIIDEECD